MNRVPILWPLVLTSWVLLAVVGSVIDERWSVVVCGVLTLVVAWAIWLVGDRSRTPR